MDTLRGHFADRDEELDDLNSYDSGEVESGHDGPPPGIGNDERRMQVRAYNHWAGLLEDRNYPAIEDLEPENLPDFGPYSVLLDFTNGIENPGISFLGAKLAEECDADEEIRTLAEVPSRSLLSRITDHYMQILANQAPIGFEAEFVNQRGATILYRGILLPYSSDDDTIDFIYGVINWKEMADSKATDILLTEIDQALEATSAAPVGQAELLDAMTLDEPAEDEHVEEILDLESAHLLEDGAENPVEDSVLELSTEFSDVEDLGQVAVEADEVAAEMAEADGPKGYGVLDLSGYSAEAHTGDEELPKPSFGFNISWSDGEDEDGEEDEALPSDNMFGSLVRKTTKQPIIMSDPEPLLPQEAFEDAVFKALARGTDEQDEAVEDAAELAPDLPAEEAAQDEVPAGYEAEPEPDEAVEESAGFETAPRLTEEEPPLGTGTTEIALPEWNEEDLGLYDWLASARELAMTAMSSEDRTRGALYDAIGKAYDFSIAARAEPGEFEELLADSGLAAQDRAPMTPIVKLVFGVDYDKTRVTEYATALGHAHRVGVERGQLATFLRQAEGGLKGVVKEERRLRREEAGISTVERTRPSDAVAAKLRKIEPQDFDTLLDGENEFALVMIRRTPDGQIHLLGEVPNDVSLVERAARKLLG